MTTFEQEPIIKHLEEHQIRGLANSELLQILAVQEGWTEDTELRLCLNFLDSGKVDFAIWHEFLTDVINETGEEK